MNIEQVNTPLYALKKIQQRKHKHVGIFTDLKTACDERDKLGDKGYLVPNQAAKDIMTNEVKALMQGQIKEYQIEKNVELPNKFTQGVKYPFDQMEVGDSFAFNYEEEKRVSANAYNFKKNNPGRKFTVRKLSDAQGRCWRVE